MLHSHHKFQLGIVLNNEVTPLLLIAPWVTLNKTGPNAEMTCSKCLPWCCKHTGIWQAKWFITPTFHSRNKGKTLLIIVAFFLFFFQWIVAFLCRQSPSCSPKRYKAGSKISGECGAHLTASLRQMTVTKVHVEPVQGIIWSVVSGSIPWKPWFLSLNPTPCNCLWPSKSSQ